ncbi:MAG: lysozyme [Pseudomonadota bacterium]|nr:lysozyme [Pseudomonadota bacterium]
MPEKDGVAASPLARVGIDLIKDFEGFRSEPYVRAAGYWTIGWGSCTGITADSPPIKRVEGEELLAKDLVRFERAVPRLCPVPHSQGQYDALVSFSFNTGSLSVSTLRKKVLRGDYEGAANEFPRWVFAAGRRLAGLVRRREAERALFLSG